mgnify:CR=1 FL=1
MLEQAAPLAVLAGGLFAFGQLAREQAVTAMRASGVSVYRVLGVSLVAAAGVMVIDLMALEVVAPRADLALANWWRATAAEADRAEPGDRKSTRLNSSHVVNSYGGFCLKKKNRSVPYEC